jgi:hypothetical protein
VRSKASAQARLMSELLLLLDQPLLLGSCHPGTFRLNELCTEATLLFTIQRTQPCWCLGHTPPALSTIRFRLPNHHSSLARHSTSFTNIAVPGSSFLPCLHPSSAAHLHGSLYIPPPSPTSSFARCLDSFPGNDVASPHICINACQQPRASPCLTRLHHSPAHHAMQ